MNIIYNDLNEQSDEQGMPCVYCQLEGHTNQANVYAGGGLYLCCLDCVPQVAEDYSDGEDDVLVEVGVDANIRRSNN